MKATEIIITDTITDEAFDTIVRRALAYALISLPFTIDRMRIPKEERRAWNIAKGKIAEYLMEVYCKNRQIPVDFKSCKTPFWQIDRRDFVFNNQEWDLKNNFIYTENIEKEKLINLPALIPNRHPKDQWGMRNSKVLQHTSGVKYLFTFLKGAGLKNSKRGKDFLSIHLSGKQTEFLRKLYTKYKGMPQNQKPFDEKWFWNNFLENNNKQLYKIHNKPKLIITGYAGTKHWDLFQDTGPYSPDNFKDFIKPCWYKKTGRRNSLCWLNGILWTTITNRTIPIAKLPSFNSLINK